MVNEGVAFVRLKPCDHGRGLSGGPAKVCRRVDRAAREAAKGMKSNWKTSVAGAASAAVYAWANAGNLDVKHLAVAIGIAVFGSLAKDA